MATLRTNYGRNLNRQWDVRAAHALYHKEGTWFNVLERFPGALFDPNGYVLFETKEHFLKCPQLRIGKRVTVPAGICEVPGYIRVRVPSNHH